MDDSAWVALERRVRKLEDEDAIRRLICRWGPAVDIGDSDAAASIWTDDGILTSEASRLVGPGEVKAMVDSQAQQDLIRRGCAHIQGLPTVHVDGDVAAATNYSTVFLHDEGSYQAWRVSANSWSFRRTPEGWRVTGRTANVINGDPEPRRLLAGALGDR